jgi:hypothetical protein
MKYYEINGCELLTATKTGGVKYPRPVIINRDEPGTGFWYYAQVAALFVVILVLLVVGMAL